MLIAVMINQHQVSDLGGLGKLSVPSTENKKNPVGFLVGKIPVASQGKVTIADCAQTCLAGSLASHSAEHSASPH